MMPLTTLIVPQVTCAGMSAAPGLLDTPGLTAWCNSLASASRRGTLRCWLTLIMVFAARPGRVTR